MIILVAKNLRSLPKVTLIAFLIFISYLLCDVYFIRGREVEFDDRKITLIPIDGDNEINRNFAYKIELISNGNYIISIKNNSITPYFFWLYEYPEWETKLVDSTVIKYAKRSKIFYNDELISDESESRFDCGSGLGVSMIRPYESFSDTITTKDLVETIRLPSFMRSLGDNGYFNKLTKKVFRVEHKNYDDFPVELFDIDSCFIDVDFVLPVISYVDYQHSSVVSNRVRIPIQQILQKY